MSTPLSTTQVLDFESIVAQLGFRNSQEAARQQARMLLLGRLARHEAEMQSLAAKWRTTLEEMERRYRAAGQEDFEADDDYLEWRWLQEAAATTRAQLAALDVN